MANCGISSAYTFTCADKKKAVGGLKQTVWLFNTIDLESISRNGSNEVSSLNFAAYTNVYKFSGMRLGNRLTDNTAKTDAGNSYYPISFTMQMVDITQAHRDFYEDLAQAESIGMVIQSSQDVFELTGHTVGLELTEALRDTSEPTSDAVRVLTLTGDETSPPQIVNAGSVSDTLAMLNSYT